MKTIKCQYCKTKFMMQYVANNVEKQIYTATVYFYISYGGKHTTITVTTRMNTRPTPSPLQDNTLPYNPEPRDQGLVCVRIYQQARSVRLDTASSERGGAGCGQGAKATYLSLIASADKCIRFLIAAKKLSSREWRKNASNDDCKQSNSDTKSPTSLSQQWQTQTFACAHLKRNSPLDYVESTTAGQTVSKHAHVVGYLSLIDNVERWIRARMAAKKLSSRVARKQARSEVCKQHVRAGERCGGVIYRRVQASRRVRENIESSKNGLCL